ncbi:uncharacterized protein RSE6_05112 [Rhynchosporium secalis]|uniref:Uncharacterized protein n=1 Tax=Rhynchosporium secalis TaxID=38038 RepID=A0A1E1M6Y4_RHYSE|nr:uncharacterized protein RSE6_05112 [Rhynchosporium secalis]
MKASTALLALFLALATAAPRKQSANFRTILHFAACGSGDSEDCSTDNDCDAGCKCFPISKTCYIPTAHKEASVVQSSHHRITLEWALCGGVCSSDDHCGEGCKCFIEGATCYVPSSPDHLTIAEPEPRRGNSGHRLALRDAIPEAEPRCGHPGQPCG